MTILIFFAVLFVLILVHEWGHFIVAKKNGIRVDEFGIGFPPKLFGYKKGETEYTFNLLPIGGFVKIYGEDGASAPSSPVPSRDGKPDVKLDAEPGLGGNQSKSGDNADYARSFVAQSKLAQAAVLIAGVTMNILFAWLLFALVFAFGVPTAVEESAASEEARLIVSAVMPEGPAAVAKIPVGAEIVSVTGGENTVDQLVPSTFSTFTAENESMTVSYKVGDTITETTLVPTAGVIDSEPDRPAVGVALALVETVRQPAHLAVYNGLKATLAGLRDITIGLGSLIYDSVRGQADFSQVAGPVGIVGLVGDAAEFGFTSLLMFTAFISLNLAVINMLPFPALDGGRLVFVGIEAVTRKAINPIWVARLNAAGFALLLLLMIAVTYNDILRIL